MTKHPETIEEAVKKYVEYDNYNPCWQDSWYFEDICRRYGYDAVKQEVKRQEKSSST